MVEYILILKHNLEQELSGICAKENTLSEEAEKYWLIKSLVVKNLKKAL